ncbi:MAG: DUF1887 family protein [Desulfovibrio sp.]|nr:DUF1887 family protein [Desulfovibrio sp.]
MPIPGLKHHIIFVSAQSLPTVLGASLPGKEPAQIHAVVTPDMRENAQRLRMALTARRRQCAFSEYALADSTSQESMYAVLDSIHTACNGESLGMNLTGGTKIMALAAWEWAQAYDVPAFYIDTAQEQVIRLDRTWHYAPLPDVLNVEDILLANGFAVESRDTDPLPAARRDALRRMLEIACTPEGEKALGRLNYLAEKASRIDNCVRDDFSPNLAWSDVLRLCHESGTLQMGADVVAFPDEYALRWCNGVWFEEYVRMALYRLKAEKRIKDFASSVQVRRAGVRNELDALFTVRNRLFTIECKTAAMFHDNAASILYKADSLHDRIGGVFARAMLCSVRPLAAKDRERARELGVRVVWGKGLLSLADKLITWSKEV